MMDTWLSESKLKKEKWMKVLNHGTYPSCSMSSLPITKKAIMAATQLKEKNDADENAVKKNEFVPVNKTFRKVQALLLAKEKAMKHWDMKDITFSDKIRNINVSEGKIKAFTYFSL